MGFPDQMISGLLHGFSDQMISGLLHGFSDQMIHVTKSKKTPYIIYVKSNIATSTYHVKSLF